MIDLRTCIILIGSFGCLLLICIIFDDIINTFKKKELTTKRFISWFMGVELKQQLITVCVGFCIIVTIAANTKLGSTNIGGLFERINYTESYYINLFPENANDKNYKVKAEIEKMGSRYYINKAYFSNGGYITFNNNGRNSSLKIGSKIGIYDDKDKYWRVELTNEKCN